MFFFQIFIKISMDFSFIYTYYITFYILGRIKSQADGLHQVRLRRWNIAIVKWMNTKRSRRHRPKAVVEIHVQDQGIVQRNGQRSVPRIARNATIRENIHEIVLVTDRNGINMIKNYRTKATTKRNRNDHRHRTAVVRCLVQIH